MNVGTTTSQVKIFSEGEEKQLQMDCDDDSVNNLGWYQLDLYRDTSNHVTVHLNDHEIFKGDMANISSWMSLDFVFLGGYGNKFASCIVKRNNYSCLTACCY